MRAVGNGLATLSFDPSTRMLSAFDQNEILGFAPPLVMAIGIAIPAVTLPEPIAVQLLDGGGLSALAVVIVVFLVVLAASGAGYALQGPIRRALLRRRLQ